MKQRFFSAVGFECFSRVTLGYPDLKRLENIGLGLIAVTYISAPLIVKVESNQSQLEL